MLHKDELLVNWEFARKDQSLFRIDSLRDKEKINMGNPVCVVKNVIPRRGYILLTFEDEKQCIYDFLPDLSRPIFRKHQLKDREIIVMEGARSDGQWIIVE